VIIHINRNEGNPDVPTYWKQWELFHCCPFNISIYTGVVSMSKPISTNQCYVYVYLDPRKPGNFIYGEYQFDHEPFYIGKGSNGRAWIHLKENSYNPHFNNKIKKIQKVIDRDPHIIIYKNGMSDIDAYLLEERMIGVLGRTNIKTGPLCNLTIGGIGAGSGENNHFYGKTHTDESKQKMSESQKESKYQMKQNKK